jgi:hypothetical protein
MDSKEKVLSEAFLVLRPGELSRWPYERQWMMKGRESAIPDEDHWNCFFDAECVIRKLFGEECCRGSVVEYGCGNGSNSISV